MKKTKLVLGLMLIMLLSMSTSLIAGEVQIGSNTTSFNRIPLSASSSFYYAYTQYIYLNSEVGQSGNITYIKFYWTGGSSLTWNPVTVYMGNTTKSTFSSTTDWIAVGNLTQVFNGSVSATSSAGWVQITLDNSFSYNGTDNLVVAVHNDSGDWTSYVPSWRVTYTTSNDRTLYRANYTSHINPSSPGTGTLTDQYRANIVLNLEGDMEYSSSTTETASTSDVCAGSVNNEIVRLNVVTTGVSNPINATSITFNTNGSTSASDISNAKVYYTTNTTFATTTQFGTTTANPNGSFTVTGTQQLASGNNYFWLAYDISINSTNGTVVDGECNSVTVGIARTPTVTAPSGSRTINFAPVSVIATSGTAFATYDYLKEAIDAINAGSHTGDIDVYIGDDITESSSSTLYYSGYSSVSYTSIDIKPAGGAAREITISTSSSNGLLQLYGADNVTIDGLNTGGNSLIFENTYTYNSPVIRFQGYSSSNFCTNNTLTNCTIKGNNTGPNNGVVCIYEYTSNCTVSNCDLTVASGTNYPTELIEATGNSNASYPNTNISITGNNLYDFGSSSGKTAVNFYNYNTNSTISNNKIYHTTSKTYTGSNNYHGIYVNGGSGYTINGNTIGYANSSGNGTTTLTFNSYSVSSFGIKVLSNNTSTTTINNNVITNMNITSQWGHYFYGIQFDGVSGTSGTTALNVEVTGNTIGSSSSANSIQAYSASTGMQIRCLHLGEINSSNIYQIHGTVSNNVMGGMNTSATNPATNSFITPIAFEGNSLSVLTISGNTIGYSAAPIVIGASSTGALYGFTGIYVTESGDYSITNNTINYITNYSTSTGGSGSTYGIENSQETTRRTAVISNNTIANITGYEDVFGIFFPYTSSENTISGNSIYNLNASADCFGMYIWCRSKTIISANTINTLSASGSSNYLYGIYFTGTSNTYGDNVIKNNLIYLGKNSVGGNVGDVTIYGINEGNSHAYTNVYFNTSVLTGDVASSINNTYAYYRASTYNQSTYIKDNIFANLRNNTSGSAKHYGIFMGSNSSIDIDNNDYYAPNTGGVMGYRNGDRADLTTWLTYFSGDDNSINSDPQFVNMSGNDFKLEDTSPCFGAGTSITGITTDIEGTTRGDPPDIGAYENTTAVEFTNGSSFSPTLILDNDNQAFGRFKLSRTIAGASLTAATIKLNGTRTGMSNIKLWESVDATFEATGESDTQLGFTVGTDPGDGNSVSFSGFSSNISTSGMYYFITCDVASDATGSIQAVLVNNSSLTLSGSIISGTIDNAALSSGETPLPIELSSFTASVNKNDVNLNWSTASEINNAGFDIERQSIGEGKDFWTKIGFVEGYGTTNEPKNYSYQDRKLNTGEYSYRLVQRDYNNRGVEHSLSDVVSVGVPNKYKLSQNFPNPFNPKTKIGFELPVDSKVNIQIFDMLGREVATLVNGNKESGYHTVEFDGSNLSSGMYFYRIHTESFEAVKRMLLVK